MDLTCIFFGATFIILGIWFAFFKGYENIRAWKSMSDDEKAKIKIAPLCRNVGEVIALCGVIFLLKGIWEVEWFIYAIIAWFIIAGLDVWYISKSSHYKNTSKKITRYAVYINIIYLGGDTNGKERNSASGGAEGCYPRRAEQAHTVCRFKRRRGSDEESAYIAGRS